VARLSLRNMVSKEANSHVIGSILYLFNLVELRMRGLSPIDLDELFAQVDTVMVEHRVRQHVAWGRIRVLDTQILIGVDSDTFNIKVP